MARPKTIPMRDEAQDAFHVHSALLSAEVTFPWLRDNPQWRLLRMDAFETFHNLYMGCANGK